MVVVRRSGNLFADVSYSAPFSETLGVVMWTVVFFVICLAAPFLSGPLSCKQDCKAVMFVGRKRNSNMVSERGFGRRGSRKRCTSFQWCQERTKTGKGQIVSGGLLDVLKRALWWFTVAILAICALTDQSSESQLLMGPKYTIKKDGLCWGISGKWWCLSWGTAQAPVLEVKEEVLEPEPACDTVHCYVRKGVDLSFETLGLFLDNFISLWIAGMKFISAALIESSHSSGRSLVYFFLL